MAKRVKRGNKRLVIVESPAKARTLAGILGSDYDVLASVGHVRDLPKSKLGVATKHGFTPQYIFPKDKKTIVKEIQKTANQTSENVRDTDPYSKVEAIPSD